MVTLTRPDGTQPGDLNLSRRGLGLALTGGYALAAFSAEAQPVTTDEAGLVTATVQLAAADREVPAYVARPAGRGRHPAVLVVPEIFGVHEYIRDVCRRLAKAGYVAIAPDFFVRAGDPSKMTDMAAIMKIVSTSTDARVTGDIAAALKYLKAQSFVNSRKLAVTGFCWGGNVTWEAVARYPEFKAGVAWYGRLAVPAQPSATDPDGKAPIQLVGELKAPVLGLYAEKDNGIPQKDVDAMNEALKAAGKTTSSITVFPGTAHGFHADYRPSYNKAAAEDGWKQMLAHFANYGVKG